MRRFCWGQLCRHGSGRHTSRAVLAVLFETVIASGLTGEYKHLVSPYTGHAKAQKPNCPFLCVQPLCLLFWLFA